MEVLGATQRAFLVLVNSMRREDEKQTSKRDKQFAMSQDSQQAKDRSGDVPVFARSQVGMTSRHFFHDTHNSWSDAKLFKTFGVTVVRSLNVRSLQKDKQRFNATSKVRGS